MSEERVDDLEVSVNEPHNELTQLADTLMSAVADAMREASVEGVDVVVIAVKGVGQGGRVYQGVGSTISDMKELAHVLTHSLMAVVDPEVLARVGKVFDREDSS